MEYLVTMTTHVPEGTPDGAVDDVRAREAAHSKELAREGHLLRLWRPPLQPGEWRSLGLFDASDDDELQAVLLSMPLRIWRTDEVAPLSPHPDDPGPRPARIAGAPSRAGGGSEVGGSEFLTTFTTTIPPDTVGSEVDAATARESGRARELVGQGKLLRLWTAPGEGRTLGLWRARDTDEVRAMVDSMPLSVWSHVEITPLTLHPSDPGSAPG